MSTVDAFYEAPKGELDFRTDAGDGFDTISTEQLDAADTLVFGRATDERMDFDRNRSTVSTSPQTPSKENPDDHHPTPDPP